MKICTGKDRGKGLQLCKKGRSKFNNKLTRFIYYLRNRLLLTHKNLYLTLFTVLKLNNSIYLVSLYLRTFTWHCFLLSFILGCCIHIYISLILKLLSWKVLLKWLWPLFPPALQTVSQCIITVNIIFHLG